MRKVEFIMGMPVTIDIPDGVDSYFDKAYDRLKDIDKKYSPYIESSELSKIWKNDIEVSEYSEELNHIYHECKKFEKITDGYFSAYFEKRFNPTGYVKGWAIKQASDILKTEHHKDFLIIIAGDISVSSESDKIWTLGVQDPLNSKNILASINIKNGSLATSGNYERGEHIINPLTGLADSDILSVSVAGQDIIRADVYATAIFAMGKEKAIKFIRQQADYGALIVTKDNKIYNVGDFFDLKNESLGDYRLITSY